MLVTFDVSIVVNGGRTKILINVLFTKSVRAENFGTGANSGIVKPGNN